MEWLREYDPKKEGLLFVEYRPHNVDITEQAYALFSLWLNWANLARAFINHKD